MMMLMMGMMMMNKNRLGFCSFFFFLGIPDASVVVSLENIPRFEDKKKAVVTMHALRFGGTLLESGWTDRWARWSLGGWWRERLDPLFVFKKLGSSGSPVAGSLSLSPPSSLALSLSSAAKPPELLPTAAGARSRWIYAPQKLKRGDELVLFKKDMRMMFRNMRAYYNYYIFNYS